MLKNFLSKHNLSLFIFLFINFIFSVKYLSRKTDLYLIISLLLVVIYFIIYKSRNKLIKYNNYLSKVNFGLIFIFCLLFYFVFQKINVESLNVDRWSVITSFWDNYFNDKYVYFARSSMNNLPGPMPFYYILALPFYFLKELGYFSILGIIVFYLIMKYNKTLINIQTNSILLILSSVFCLWEVACRSNIFLNASIILFVMVFYFNQKKLNYSKLFLIAIFIGLSLSTRNVLIIPFIITFTFALKSKKINLQQLFFMGTIAFIVFGLTFLPFVINHFEDFKIANPFITQSSVLMPFDLTLIFILLAFVFGFVCKNSNDAFFYSGLLLFLTIVGYFVYHFYHVGFYKTFFDSFSDISYFILCTPFFIFYLTFETNSSLKNTINQKYLK